MKETRVGEAEVVLMPENDVIEDSDSEDLAGPVEPLSALAVLPAWRRIAGGMIVQENESRTAVFHRRSKNFPGVDDRCAEATNGNEDIPDQLVFGIQMKGEEILSVGAEKSCSIALKEIPAVGEALTRAQGRGTEPSAQRECRIQRMSLSRRDASRNADLLHRCLGELDWVAEFPQQPSSRTVRGGASASVTQHQGKQTRQAIRIRKGIAWIRTYLENRRFDLLRHNFSFRKSNGTGANCAKVFRWRALRLPE